MEIDLIFKIAAIGLIVAVLNQVLNKADKSEYATVITLVGIVIVLLMVIPQISDLFDAVKDFMDF
ncbi:MAG: stage III sporulation protein AC [Acutalibacteraceae bacterium]